MTAMTGRSRKSLTVHQAGVPPAWASVCCGQRILQTWCVKHLDRLLGSSRAPSQYPFATQRVHIYERSGLSLKTKTRVLSLLQSFASVINLILRTRIGLKGCTDVDKAE
jgi:hypothetical protein